MKVVLGNICPKRFTSVKRLNLMQTAGQNPITWLQRLLAAHSLRKDGYEHLLSEKPDFEEKYKKRPQESERQAAQLLEELAAYGDAAQSEATQDKDYRRIWASIKENQSSTEEINKSESLLIQLYDEALADAQLPESLRDLLETQRRELASIKS